MAFGDNGNRKKTPFEILVQIVVIFMILITLGGVVFSAINVLM
ncbi:DUF4044 domain-containing protein [Streptococcus hillyeri]|uniref:DUF4044 domain-containing protein n=1 Tax=Streptococcus hillyeri TaxID=2282420 RepID=A0A3L9DPI9_9STRE|nr:MULTISPECIES: DUF4044 domain-containing protein [Streptococcus]RLY02925.1 DUF4044 domain-containing protein [Streptococcus hillyeri]